MSTKSKTATSPKAAAPAAAKLATAPKKVAAVPAAQSTKPAKTTAEPKPKSKPVAKAAATPAAKPAPKTVAPEVVKATAPASKASPAPDSAPKLVAKEAAEPLAAKSNNVFGFGAMFMDPSAMEPYLQLWKTPEIDAMVSASNDALEESVSVANEAFTKLFETMTGQSDVFSGAGSRVVAQCEELLDTQQKSFEEVWQASMALFEKTGGIGTELATWMQCEIEASQADIDALTKVESLSDIQELQTRILNRCYESSVAEGEKVQEIMMSVMADSFNAMTKAANTVTK
ncbi:phasin family protein [Thalassospira lucentensis]|uniref:phasin family protein n=1 Tax=Thalassospira lucentensis TaxID=168935 RepID=UPI003D2F2AA7